MIAWLRRWPPALWLLVYVGSLLVLNGGRGDPAELIAGVLLCAIALGMGTYLAIGRWPGHPRPRGFWWAFGGLFAAFGLAAAVAGANSLAWGLAVIAGAFVPATALVLTFAWFRSKTVRTTEGARDVSAPADDDPYPAVGMDAPAEADDAPPPEEKRFERGAPARERARR